MNRVEENGVGIQVNSPVLELSKNLEYQQLKAYNVKEMDCIWKENTILFLVELKGYYDPANTKHKAPDFTKKELIKSIEDNLIKKAEHTLAMILSKRCKISELSILENANEIRLYFLIKINEGDRPVLANLNDSIKTKLKPICTIHNVKEYQVLDHSLVVGTKEYPWVV